MSEALSAQPVHWLCKSTLASETQETLVWDLCPFGEPPRRLGSVNGRDGRAGPTEVGRPLDLCFQGGVA